MNQKIIDQRNEYRVCGKTVVLTITGTIRKEKTEIRFDHDQLDKVRQHCWRVATGRLNGRQVATGTHTKKSFLPLAHLVVGSPPAGKLVRYIDRDWKNCKASNFEITSRRKLAIACGNGRNIKR